MILSTNYPSCTLFLVTFFVQDGDQGQLIPNASDPTLLTELEHQELLKSPEESHTAFLVSPVALTINAALHMEQSPFMSPHNVLHSLEMNRPQDQTLYFPGGKVMPWNEFLDLSEYKKEMDDSLDKVITSSHFRQQVGKVSAESLIILPQPFNGRLSIPILRSKFLLAKMI